jgi:acetyl-CoA carboxylase/biotin carboxylase 1
MTDIRNFYEKPTGDIDFLKDEYRPITNHVIAARITGENADDGFRPTSGQLERIRFQGSPKTWGYFAIGPNGSIHEFSDSQFGHIFASGADREEARQELRYALQNTDVYGEIRTPIEYLIELLGKNEFKDNEFSTGWLDGLIALRQAGQEPKGEHESPVEPVTKADIVLSAAVYQAILTKNANLESVINSLDKFQVAEIKQKISEFKEFKVETVYDNVRYRFQFQLTGPSSFNCQVLDANDGILQEIPISTREQPDGSVMIVINNQVSRVSGVEDVFGLRIRVGDRQTVSIPKAVDPSEIRSEVNGKLVRYLKNEGDVLQKGDVFCELEAMKMIMEVRTPEAGIFSPTISPGALVPAGSLIGKLDLGEATVVKLTENTEAFDLSDSDWTSANQEPISRPLLEEITDALAGYSIESVETKIQEYLKSLNDTTYLATVEEWMTKLIRTMHHSEKMTFSGACASF